jgi:hypothetical protein
MPPEGEARNEESELESLPAKWQDLEGRWKAILGLEAAIDTVRMSMEGLLAETEGSLKKPLTMEEKTYALRADVAQWERAKNHAHYAVPKMKDFIRRSIWATGSPEKKQLGELYKEHIQPRIPFPEMDAVLKQLDDLRKDRQVLSEQGKTVYQECRGTSAEIQRTLKALQDNAKRKKAASGSKGGFFKGIR